MVNPAHAIKNPLKTWFKLAVSDQRPRLRFPVQTMADMHVTFSMFRNGPSEMFEGRGWPWPVRKSAKGSVQRVLPARP